MKNIYFLIMEKLKTISNKEVEYGYIEDLSYTNNILLENKFLMNVESLNAETISINHRKQKERVLNFKYIKFNNINTNNLEEIVGIENIIDTLIKDIDILERVINIDYDFKVEYEKDNENDILGVLIIDITLKIKER